LSYFNGSSYTFTWQKGRELASAQKNGVTTTYTYGADGLRISKSSGYEFFYSDGRLVRQLWADGEVLDFLYDESGTPYAMQYYSTMYYYVKNLQGDVVAIADANGNIVVNYAYDAWGNILSITDGSGNDISNNTWHIGNLNPIRYRSYYYDTETGFYYLQSRYYDPAIRRFINADGYINANGDILGFNMYAYCGNNPVFIKDSLENYV
jgi:RHS repeat-associated protein